MSDEPRVALPNRDALVREEGHSFLRENPGEGRLPVSRVSCEHDRSVRKNGARGVKKHAAAHREREQALTARYRQLLGLANQLARQKAAIYAARHQIEDKLKRAEQLHRELAELGGQVTSQLDRIDELLPGDSATDPSGPPVGPREAGH